MSAWHFSTCPAAPERFRPWSSLWSSLWHVTTCYATCDSFPRVSLFHNLSLTYSLTLSPARATLQLSSDWEQWLTKLQEWEWGCVKARGLTTGKKIPKPGYWPLFYVATLNIPAITHVWSCEVRIWNLPLMHGHQNMLFHHHFMTKRK